MMIINEKPLVSLDLLNEQHPHNYARSLTAFYQAAIDHRLPIALWRYPGSQDKQALVDFSDLAYTDKIDFTKKLPGFAFSPFINEDGNATLFIKAGLHLNQTGHHLYSEYSIFDNFLEQNNKIRFLESYQQLLYGLEQPKHGWVYNDRDVAQNTVCSEVDYCRLVAEAINYTKSTNVKKIVLSRAMEAPLPLNFKPLTTFEALCNRYPQAFISLVSIPTIGTWIGASPETLLSMGQDSLCTVALAGTQARHPEVALTDVQWGAKEIEEQALVSDYIRHFFQQQHLASFSEVGPRTVSAGNVVHLQTKFEVLLDEPRLSHLANQVLYRLHPTSAVCGTPKQEALAFILEKEGYDRAFYSGFLGPVHLDRQSNLFVNLRCMQLKRDRALLYVGGGITKDSVPKAEWLETVLKSKTLLDVLQQYDD